MTQQSRLMADVSDYQAAVNLRAYRKAGRRVIMLKAADHNTIAGATRYPQRATEAHDLGLTVIHYVMALFTVDPATTIDFYIDRIRPYWKHGDRMLIDVEDYSGTPAAAVLWLHKAQRRLQDVHEAPEALAYTNEAYLAAGGPVLASTAPWWLIAAYDGRLLGRGGTPKLPRDKHTHAQLLGKQYTDGQIGAEPRTTPGIGACDDSILTCAGARELLPPAPRLARRKLPQPKCAA